MTVIYTSKKSKVKREAQEAFTEKEFYYTGDSIDKKSASPKAVEAIGKSIQTAVEKRFKKKFNMLYFYEGNKLVISAEYYSKENKDDFFAYFGVQTIKLQFRDLFYEADAWEIWTDNISYITKISGVESKNNNLSGECIVYTKEDKDGNVEILKTDLRI